MIRCGGDKGNGTSCDNCEIAGIDSCPFRRGGLPVNLPFIDNAIPDMQFLCTLAILGPLPFSPTVLEAATNPWTVIASTDQILEEAVRPWHFRLNALFTMPEARGKGLAMDLIAEALSFSRDFSQHRAVEEEHGGFVVSIAVEEDNIAARKLYEKCGFQGIGDVEIGVRPGDDREQRKIMLLEYRENS